MKKYNKILNIIIAITAAFTLICYVSYFIKLFIFSEGRFPLFVAICVICAVTLPILFRKVLQRLLKKAYIIFKSAFAFGMLFYMVTFISMCLYLAFTVAGETPPEELPEDTVIVVFGAKIYDYGPGITLKRRLDKAYNILSDNPGSVCIVSGGQGENEPAAESEIMKNYLVDLGVEPERIYEENQSSNTIENIAFSSEILRETGMDKRPVTAVSSDFHIPRIKLISERSGFAQYYYHAKSASPFYLFTMLVREYMSYVKLFVFYR